jgi:hypothetical protein
MTCWLGTDDDPNSDCHMARPFTIDDVQELRSYYLDLVETVIEALWKGQYSPGDGSIHGNWQSVVIGNNDVYFGEEETFLTWYVRLDEDSMMFDLSCSGADSVAIWLSYDAIIDRPSVLSALSEARMTLSTVGEQRKVWPTLVTLV